MTNDDSENDREPVNPDYRWDADPADDSAANRENASRHRIISNTRANRSNRL